MSSIAEPDVAVTATLVAADIGVTLGDNLVRGPIRQPRPPVLPHEAVFCLSTGGPPPRYFISGPGGPKLRFGVVQVTIRSEPASSVDSFESGQQLARSVWRALDNATVTGYVKFDARDSEPVYLGQDDTEHHLWVVNVETTRREE